MVFTVDYKSILQLIEEINPITYCRNRNFLDGNVSKLSPYVSRGVISTKQIYDSVLARGFNPKEIEGFLKQLAWRDYFQQTLIAKPYLAETEIKFQQTDVENRELSLNIVKAQTTIKAIDDAINSLYVTGYMHNHVRMYVSSMVTNIAKSDWRLPSKWMYYYLLDADVASNSCSWQWICGANSSKKYYANQENINKYAGTNQSNTFLDVSYEEIATMPIPTVLKETTNLDFYTNLPQKSSLKIDVSKPTLLYNFYNLDPIWHQNEEFNRVLLLEPSHFNKFPVSENTIDFVKELSKNISSIQIYCGEYEDLKKEYQIRDFIFKEHPLFAHYEGKKEARDWIFPNTKGYFPSFFNYWNASNKNM